MKDKTAILLGVGAVAAWWLLSKTTAVVKAATGAASGAIATVYENLTFGPSVQVIGNVDSQAGQPLGPVSSFPAAHDSQGNTYLLINGAAYQLGPRDAAGNFTAIPAQPGPGVTFQ